MRVQIIVHQGVRRAVVMLGLEHAPHQGFVMAPTTYDELRPKLREKYGEYEEKEVAASPELIAKANEIRRHWLLQRPPGPATNRQDEPTGRQN